MKNDNSGPAFPVSDFRGIHEGVMAAVEGIEGVDERDQAYQKAAGRICRGMTLRAYIATHALAGILADSGNRDAYEAKRAAQAVAHADALLAELEK